MARELRIQDPGAVYHVMSRGDRREAIFDDAERLVKTSLKQIKWKEKELVVRRKGDAQKVRLAYELRAKSLF